MISTLQIIMIIFALFAFSRAIIRLKKNQITVPEFIFWSSIWVLTIFVAFLPEVTTIVSSFLGIGRGVDLLIYVGLLILFYLVFRILVQVENLQQNITKITTHLALQDVKKDVKNKEIKK